MRTAIFIQARSGSMRHPGKVFEAIPDPASPAMIEHIYRRMSAVEGGDVVAVLIPREDVRLFDFCNARKMEVFTGPADDVRERYRLASLHYDTKLVVRATGDNPCVDPAIAAETVRKMKESPDLDLFSFSNLPLGTAVEAFRRDALFDDRFGADPLHAEHVTLHIKHNPDHFRVVHAEHELMKHFSIKPPRVTVDTAEDLAVVRTLFRELGNDFTLYEFMEWASTHPDLMTGNAHIEQRVFTPA